MTVATIEKINNLSPQERMEEAFGLIISPNRGKSAYYADIIQAPSPVITVHTANKLIHLEEVSLRQRYSSISAAEVSSYSYRAGVTALLAGLLESDKIALEAQYTDANEPNKTHYYVSSEEASPWSTFDFRESSGRKHFVVTHADGKILDFCKKPMYQVLDEVAHVLKVDKANVKIFYLKNLGIFAFSTVDSSRILLETEMQIFLR
jgi:hypothetical protein